MKEHFLFLGIILAGVILHAFLRYETFSFFMFPLAFSTLLPHIKPSSLLPLLAIIIISELFTSLPLGVMTCVVLIPFLLRIFFQRISADISLKFLALITGTVWLQLSFLTAVSIILSWPHTVSTETLLSVLPITALAGAGIVTPLITYIMAVMWHEMTPASSAVNTISTLPNKNRYS